MGSVNSPYYLSLVYIPLWPDFMTLYREGKLLENEHKSPLEATKLIVFSFSTSILDKNSNMQVAILKYFLKSLVQMSFIMFAKVVYLDFGLSLA